MPTSTVGWIKKKKTVRSSEKIRPSSRKCLRTQSTDAAYYLLAALAGILTGWADAALNDLLFTALLVLASCMALGLARPRWPLRWVAAVVLFIPLTELAAYLLTTIQPTRAQIYGSFLTALPGTAGAYGGAVMRRVIDNLRQGK
jgi:ABC-type multidrug transport system permease subunit